MLWRDCVKNDTESLGLSQKDAQSRNKCRRRIKGQPANPGSPGKMAIKTECVYFYVICVFCLLVVLIRLSVAVQVIDWKDSSPK